MAIIEQYTRQAAAARGIDPDTAVRVARSEGGLHDPFQQSNIVKNGVREPSFGPFQLYMNGGLGNKALAAGIDPRTNWQGGVDFALNAAAQGGWSPWYGARAVGVGNWDGLNGAKAVGVGGQPTMPSPSSPAGGARAASEIQPFGAMAPGGSSQPAPLDTDIAEYWSGKEPMGIDDRLAGFGKGLSEAMEGIKAPRISQSGGDARQTGNQLLKAMGAMREANEMLKRRLAPFYA
jgi:hypothetical protein